MQPIRGFKSALVCLLVCVNLTAFSQASAPSELPDPEAIEHGSLDLRGQVKRTDIKFEKNAAGQDAGQLDTATGETIKKVGDT